MVNDAEDSSRKRHHESDHPGPASLSRPVSPPPRKKRRQVKKIGSPWSLTWIRDLDESANKDAITLKDILGDPLISECWEFNYLHDIPFLMDAFDVDTRHLVKVHIVHGFWKREDPNGLQLKMDASTFENVQLHTAPMPEMFGTHHSKMMILLRHDDMAQVVIHTANMIPKDWTNMTNAVWRSPLLPKCANAPAEESGLDPGPVGSRGRFKSDLLAYLQQYDRRVEVCQPLVKELSQFDFSAVKASLIASVPGKHAMQSSLSTSWGWPAVRKCLRQIPVAEGTSDITIQISSIATLGAKDDWLRKTLFESLAHSKSVPMAKATFKVVFPTADEIRRSLDGYASGGSIHTKIQSQQQAKQLQYLRPILHHWSNDSPKGKELDPAARCVRAGHGRAAPHIKTYIRSTGNKIDWALLTSANLSKQAWGEAANATGEVRIASWEIGVLVWPQLLDDDAVMVTVGAEDRLDASLASEVEESKSIIGLRIPYDLPLQRYGDGEVPWVATTSHSEPDCLGQTWHMD